MKHEFKRYAKSAVVIGLVGIIGTMPMYATTSAQVGTTEAKDAVKPEVKESKYLVPNEKFIVENATADVNIQVPKLQGFKNQEMQNKVNQELVELGNAQAEEYLKISKELKKINSAAKYGKFMNYEVLADTADWFSFRVNIVTTQASAMQESKYYTVNKRTEQLVTLSTLFKDQKYVQAVSQNIIEQMNAQMKADENKVYWIRKDDMDPFKQIKPNQDFYINKEGQVVIAFNKYEVAPGMMGAPQFVIPTSITTPLLKK